MRPTNHCLGTGMLSFTSDVVQPPVTIFMGIDKYENEDLLRWGWPEDVWFHVDKVSSAHVYLRLAPGESLDNIPSQVLADCGQLVKANSIQGNKMNNVKIVYTMWENLKKTADMDVGQVGFKDQKQVRYMTVEKRLNEVVNRLTKTKVEKAVDFQKEREERDRRERENTKQVQREQRKREEEEARQKEEERRLKSYDTLMRPENMAAANGNDSDDFM